jgi:hypothetical protein
MRGYPSGGARRGGLSLPISLNMVPMPKMPTTASTSIVPMFIESRLGTGTPVATGHASTSGNATIRPPAAMKRRPPY